jgi:hypothetical protein
MHETRCRAIARNSRTFRCTSALRFLTTAQVNCPGVDHSSSRAILRPGGKIIGGETAAEPGKAAANHDVQSLAEILKIDTLSARTGFEDVAQVVFFVRETYLLHA